MNLKEHLKTVKPGIAKIILLVAEKSKEVKKAFLTHNKWSDSSNIYGEQQLELDKWADKIFIDALAESKIVKTIASEEQSEIIEIVKCDGSYGVTLDPLDGVSCVDTNLAVGTIVGIFDEGDVLEKGTKMDAAMYILYGPLLTLVYSAKNGVHEFVLDSKGEFILKRENLKMPEGKIYSPGGLAKDYIPEHEKYLRELEKKGYKLRYSGSFTADIHQILIYGGVFTYPALKGAPNGKLRLLFECNPISFLIKQAGGACSTGKEDINHIKPASLSQRTPIYVGSKSAIELLKNFYGG